MLDPDTYTDSYAKDAIELITKQANAKDIGRAVSSLWREVSSGKPIANIPEAQRQLMQELQRFLERNQIEVTPENINKHLQRGLFSAQSSLFGVYNELAGGSESSSQASILTQQLNELLQPDKRLIEIFNKTGINNFTERSGFLPNPNDTAYLAQVIELAKENLSEADVQYAKARLDQITQVINRLYTIRDKIKQKIDKVTDSTKQEGSNIPEPVIEQFAKIQKSFIGGENGSSITSRFTNDFIFTISNLRQCLSIRGFNNDTDLTFMEPYKFYLAAQKTGDWSGTMTDQIVHMVPISREKTKGRLGFVLDDIYGNSSRDVVASNLTAVASKVYGLKKKYPNAELSIVLPYKNYTRFTKQQIFQILEDAGIENAKTCVELRAEQRVVANEPKSEYADHYIEYTKYGGGGRASGNIEVDTAYEIVFHKETIARRLLNTIMGRLQKLTNR